MDNSILIKRDGQEIELYLNKLDAYVDEYMATVDEDNKDKPSTWLGVLKYIYAMCFRPSRSQRYNSNSLLGDSDPLAIKRVWDWYCAQAYKFGRTPTIAQFGILTGIERRTFQKWKDGTWRTANPAYCDTTKKMYAEAEAALEARAYESNSVSAIFGLKASHNWRETAPITEEFNQITPHDTPEQIAARHATATLPVKPDLD